MGIVNKYAKVVWQSGIKHDEVSLFFFTDGRKMEAAAGVAAAVFVDSRTPVCYNAS